MQPSGNIFFIDDYGVQYQSNWTTVGSQVDLTTITRSPHVWGESDQGYVRNGVVFRRGIITVQRQIITLIANGYVVVADGASQYIDFFQTNFPCGGGPVDSFVNHLNDSALDGVDFGVISGPRWADLADITYDAGVVWAPLDANGHPIPSTSGATYLTFIDVWH